MAENWAIVVGINIYEFLKSLKYAQRDAEEMEAWFKKEGGFDEVFLFTNNSLPIDKVQSREVDPPIPTTATYIHLRTFLQIEFEEPPLSPGDNLWFFFAGHGEHFKDKDYLMLSDSNPGDLEYTAISIDFVTEQLRRSGADNVVLLLDACRNEHAGSRGSSGIQQEHKGVVTFYSCSSGERSWEIEKLQHGSFTYALLEGLRNKNYATVERLYEYLRDRVPQINKSYGKDTQKPYLKAEPPWKMGLILLEQFATPQDIKKLKKAQKEGDLELAEQQQLWSRILAVSPGDSDATAAIERIVKKVTIKQSQTQTNEPSNILGINPFQEKIIWIALILLGLSVASLIFSYEIFYSQPWHDEYSLDDLSGWIIESLRSFILLVGLYFIIGVSFEKETQEVFGICELKKEYVLPAKIARYILLFIASISTIGIFHYHINIAPQELANITNNPTDILENNKFHLKYQLPYICYLAYSFITFIVIGGSIILTVLYSAFKDIVNLSTLKKSFDASRNSSNYYSEIESYFQDFYQNFKAIILRYINLFITVILILCFELLIGKYTLSSQSLKLTNLAYNIYMIDLSILLIVSYFYYDSSYNQSEDILKSRKRDVSQFKKEYNTLIFFWDIFIKKLPIGIFIIIVVAILSITLQ